MVKDANNWFSKSVVEAISVNELLQNIDKGKIALPSFQRGAVWRAEQITFLWDSLLRNYPIGSLMLVRGIVENRPIQNSKQFKESDDYKWLILDGQQRCNALSLASNNTDNLQMRLWVDANELSENGKAKEPNDNSNPIFRLTTIAQPWGINCTDKNKRDARDLLCKYYQDYYQDSGSGPEKFCRKKGINKNRLNEVINKDRFWDYPDPWLNLFYTWPHSAKIPIPMDILFLEEAANEKDLIQRLSPVIKKIEDYLLQEQEEKLELDDIINKLIKMRDKLNKYTITMVKVPDEALEDQRNNSTDNKEIADRLNDVFTRINRQGTNLSEAELFFSAIKTRFPQAHYHVKKIHEDPETGHVLTPIQIIHAETRLAISQEQKDNTEYDTIPDMPKLTLKNFPKLFKQSNQNDNTNLLDKIIERINDNSSPPFGLDYRNLHESLKVVRKTLEYDSNYDSNGNWDIGLPLPLLAKLNWRIWHALAAWVGRQKEEEKVYNPNNRQEMIRFALIHHFFYYASNKKDSGTQIPFQITRLERQQFPGKEIISELKEQNFLLSYAAYYDERENNIGYLTPEQYEIYAYGNRNDSVSIGDGNTIYTHILHREEDLLFWLQRKWVHKWFYGIYDPLHHRHSDEKPFEIDHIAPSSWFYHVKTKGEYFDQYMKLNNCIGNKRIWPKNLKRIESDKELSSRFLLDADEKWDDKKNDYEFWHMNNPADIQNASRFPQKLDSEQEEWEVWNEFYKLSKKENTHNKKDWSNDSRILSFVKAVTLRRCRLYKEFYERLLDI